ncbi:MAG: NAD(P)-dependent oxidoreductase [Acetobacteraceae bacterium]|nr:NAD(P)-dependent oxidoreductase [Acetobacteraceae bacterium]
MRVGFVGVGNMGGPMAARLAAAGHQLRLFDADHGRARAAAARTGAELATAATVATDCEAVVTILPTSREVLEAVDAMGEALAPGTVLVEMSSGLPSATQALATRLGTRGVAVVDAPVSGGVAKARTGDLAIMVGGADGAVACITPLLRAMGKDILRTGPVGSAHAMKALNNLVSAAGFLAGIEALLIGSRFGLDPAVMVDVLNASTGRNNSTERKFRQFVLSRTFDSGFGLDLMAKDLATALAVAHETRTPAPFSAQCRELWAAAAALLGPGQDHTAMATFCEKLAGSQLAGPPGASR